MAQAQAQRTQEITRHESLQLVRVLLEGARASGERGRRRRLPLNPPLLLSPLHHSQVRCLLRVVSSLKAHASLCVCLPCACSLLSPTRRSNSLSTCRRTRTRQKTQQQQSIFHTAYLRGLLPADNFQEVNINNLDGALLLGHCCGSRARAGGADGGPMSDPICFCCRRRPKILTTNTTQPNTKYNKRNNTAMKIFMVKPNSSEEAATLVDWVENGGLRLPCASSARARA